jgi:hypothetical protein
MPLCQHCQAIPYQFFVDDDEVKNSSFALGQSIPHLPTSEIKRSGLAGCSLCQIMAASIDDDLWQDDQLQSALTETQPSSLKRARLSTNEGFQIYIGKVDVSKTYFFHVPSPWSKESQSASLLKSLIASRNPTNSFAARAKCEQ